MGKQPRSRPISSRLALLLLAAASLTACERRPADAPVEVSVIGGPARIASANRGPLGEPSRVLTGAVAQGLVGFDAAGQIERGAAQRWIVTDNGRSLIFRIEEARWPDGERLTAEQAAGELRSAFAAASRNPLKPLLEPIDEVVAITPEVLEIRLDIARPPMLQLLARPELALIEDGSGTGPFRARRESGVWRLEPVLDPALTEEEREEALAPERTLRLRGERAALAIARFVNRKIDLVLGGTFAELPLVRAADAQPNQLRRDPVLGLFGLQVVEQRGFLADPENRRALSMAIDRAAVLAPFAVQNWPPAQTLLPRRFGAAAEPAEPGWTALAIAQRRSLARARMAIWRSDNEEPVRLRVSMPEGPGARLLFMLIAAEWRRIGVEAELVALDADADLRLVDRVAPAESAIWYLEETVCPTPSTCDEAASEALEAARAAPTLAERAARLSEADVALAQAATFIPLAMPLRWSLVAPRLNGFRENARAIHPLNHLFEAN